jgi:hypothetical protein
MKNVKWKVALGSRVLDCGTKRSESERLVLDELLNGELGKFPVVPDQSYTLEAGDLLASAYGDEFQRVREAHVMDEKEMDVSGGHLFAPPPVPGLPCAHPSMNRDAWIDGEKHAACDDCDYVAPDPVMKRKWKPPAIEQEIADADHDRKREDRALEGAIKAVGGRVVRSIIQEALERVLGAVPAKSATLCHPEDHKVVAHRHEELAGESFYCVVCGARYLHSDQERLMSRVPWTEADIRRRMK